MKKRRLRETLSLLFEWILIYAQCEATHLPSKSDQNMLQKISASIHGLESQFAIKMMKRLTCSFMNRLMTLIKNRGGGKPSAAYLRISDLAQLVAWQAIVRLFHPKHA